MSEKPELPKRSDFRFAHRLRVRWVEVDMQKIVFNGHYLMYIDTAVADYWRGLLMPYLQAMEALGGDLYVKKASLTYHASAQYDDVLDVCIKCASLGRSSMVFEAAIFHGPKCLISADLLYVYADPKSQRAQPVPDVLRAWLLDFEAGLPMADLKLEQWATCSSEVSALRRQVFHDELGVDAAVLCDASDETALHAVLRNRMGQLVAAGRLIERGDERGDALAVGRMAAVRALRCAGLGAQVLAALEEAAWQRGASAVTLSAMLSAEPFYASKGYLRSGELYEQVGLPHVDMRKSRP